MRKKFLSLFLIMLTGAAVTLTGCEFSGNGSSSQTAAKTKSNAEVAKYIPDLTVAATKKPTPTAAAANSKETSSVVTKSEAGNSASNSENDTQDAGKGNTSNSETPVSGSSSQSGDDSDTNSGYQEEKTNTDSESGDDTVSDEKNTDEENNDGGESIPFQGEASAILYDRKGNYITVYPDGGNWYDAEGIFYMTEDEFLTGDCPFINENGESWYLTELPEN